jgi:hypothetical protein
MSLWKSQWICHLKSIQSIQKHIANSLAWNGPLIDLNPKHHLHINHLCHNQKHLVLGGKMAPRHGHVNFQYEHLNNLYIGQNYFSYALVAIFGQCGITTHITTTTCMIKVGKVFPSNIYYDNWMFWALPHATFLSHHGPWPFFFNPHNLPLYPPLNIN